MDQEVDYKHSRLMCNYCTQGKWELAEQFAMSNPNLNLLKTKIDFELGRTALCIAVMLISENDFLVKDYSEFAVLHHVATNGNKEAAAILVGKNQELTQIRNNQDETPLFRAAVFHHEELLRYLLTVPKDEDPSPFRGQDGAALLVTVIDTDLYDVALDLVNEYEEIATTRDHQGRSAIQALATKSWPSTITQSHKRSSARPSTNSNELALRKDDTSQETILHSAAKLAPTHKLEEISIAAFQVQNEIFWYKEHKDLVKKGEEWMKLMASSSMLVSTLIATVAFAAAFTVPGGNNQDKKGPLVFAVYNAVAFFSSLISVFMFVSILTARYAEEDFFRSFPRTLRTGLNMLYIAIITIQLAFVETYSLMFKPAWMVCLVLVLNYVTMINFKRYLFLF